MANKLTNKNLTKNGVSVKNKRWHKFNVINSSTAILHGTHSINDKHFKFLSRGQQGPSCTVISIVFGHFFPPKLWTPELLDKVLEYGDKLYRLSVTQNRLKPHRDAPMHSMSTSNRSIYPEFFVGDYKCWVKIEGNSVYGQLRNDIGCCDFVEGLEKFFKIHEFGILTAQGSSVAIWRYLQQGFLYFDPLPCQEHGIRAFDGVACFIKFKCLNKLGKLFIKNLNVKQNSQYCIDKVSVIKVKLIDRGPIFRKKQYDNQIIIDENLLKMLNPVELDEKIMDCGSAANIMKNYKNTIYDKNESHFTRFPYPQPISNYLIDADTNSATDADLEFQDFFNPNSDYYQLEVNIPSTFIELASSDLAILRGGTHESSDIYKEKGRTNVANCMALFAMKKVKPVNTWLSHHLDDILVIGDRLASDVQTKKPTIPTLTATDFDNSTVVINGRKYFYNVDLMTIVGMLNSQTPPILNLNQALDEFFLINNDGIIEFYSMALAIWTQGNYFYMFDPSQCDINGNKISDNDGKQEVGVVTKHAKGQCCVLRFSTLDKLTSHVLNNANVNTSNNYNNNLFTIRNITASDDVPGARIWNEFQPNETGKTWILRGTISNESEDFDDAISGQQGLAMPIIALLQSTIDSPDKWTSDVIDDVIRKGNNYYTWCMPAVAAETDEDIDEKLTLTNLKRNLYTPDNRRVKINIEESSIRGNLTAENTTLPNLTEGLKKFFENHQTGIVEVGDFSIAVWSCDENEVIYKKNINNSEIEEVIEPISYYYYFDPNARGKFGYRKAGADDDDDEDEGVACVLRARNLEHIAKIMDANIEEYKESVDDEDQSDEFFIHGFKVESISDPMTDEELEIHKRVSAKPELNRYNKISDDTACLMGNFAQNSMQFKSRTRNKQQAANALVAFAMSKIYNSHLWYPQIIDDILKIGDKITGDNMENIAEEETDDGRIQRKRNYLIPSEIDDFFDIGVNRVTFEIDEDAASYAPGDTNSTENIVNKIQEFFTTHQMGILRQDAMMLPIWKESGNIYFLFDSLGRVNGDEKNQKAHVYWFTSIPALVSTVRQLLESENTNFTIDGVTVDNEYETRLEETERPQKVTSSEKLWYNYTKISDGIWKLTSNVTLNDDRLSEDNRNKQTAALAVTAIIYSNIYQPRMWTQEILDELIMTADKIHSLSVARLAKNTNLQVNQIIPELTVSNRKIYVMVTDCVEAGKINDKPMMMNLLNGIQNFFKKFTYGVITIMGMNLAIWEVGDLIYCVIPSTLLKRQYANDGDNAFNNDDDVVKSASDIDNSNNTNKTVSIVRFGTREFVVEYLTDLFDANEDYEIHAVNVINSDKQIHEKSVKSCATVKLSHLPMLNAYKSFSDNTKAILRGGIHQGSHVFGDSIRNRQTAANCIVSLAMGLIKNPVTWTKKIMDEILVIGSNIHRETLKNKYKFNAKQFVMPTDVVRIFHVGVNILIADVEKETVIGQILMPSLKPKIELTTKKKVETSADVNVTKKEPQRDKIRDRPVSRKLNLEEGLKKFFACNKAGILIAERTMMSLWSNANIYFIYNPRACNNCGLMDDDSGTCCTMWFACLEPLADLIYQNIMLDAHKYGYGSVNGDEEESDNEIKYKISRVIVRTTTLEPLPSPISFQSLANCFPTSSQFFASSGSDSLLNHKENAFSSSRQNKNRKQILPTNNIKVISEFRAIGNQLSILLGNISMNNRNFDVTSRGFQSTAIAAVGIVVSCLHIPSTWTPDLVDSIIKYGDILYRDSMIVARCAPRTLSPRELLDVFIVGDIKATIHIQHHTNAGILILHDLTQALRLFFKNNCTGIVYTPNIAVAVMQHYGKFYILDPRGCDKFGRTRHNGAACVTKCDNIMSLASAFVRNCNYRVPCVYTINAVNILSVHFFSHIYGNAYSLSQ